MSNQNRKNMEFIHYCNTKLSNINEYNIIKVIIDNIDHISSLSLEKIADEAHISTSSVSRLISKIGFDSFQNFKYRLENENLNLKMRRMLTNMQRFIRSSDEDIVESLYVDAVANLQQTRLNLDIHKLREIINVLKKSNSVTFIGDSHELADFYTLQLDLLANGIPAFLIEDKDINLVHINSLNEKDTIVYINLYSEWFGKYQKEIIAQAKKNHVNIIIFSQDDLNIEDVIIYHYGIKNTLNDGYFSLPYLNKVLCEFLYKE